MHRPTHRDLATAAVLAVVLGGPSVAMLLIAGPGPLRGTAATAALVAAHAVLAYRRARPILAFALVTAAFAVLAASTGMFITFPSALVFPYALYSACAYGGRLATLAALAVVLLGAGGGTLGLAGDPATAGSGAMPRPGVVFLVLAALLLSAWSLGLWRHAQLAYADERARAAAAGERARIAGEMHDVVAHSLAVIISQANGGRYALPAEPETAAEVLATIARTAKAALADTRGLLGLLDPASDPPKAPQPTLAELPALLQHVRAAGVSVRQRSTGEMRELSPAAQLAVYRLVQEALTNTLRHGRDVRATEVALEWAAEGLAVSVRDDGRAPDGGDGVGLPGAGRGLTGMRARFEALGGRVEAGGGEGGGFAVRGWLPAADASAAYGAKAPVEAGERGPPPPAGRPVLAGKASASPLASARW